MRAVSRRESLKAPAPSVHGEPFLRTGPAPPGERPEGRPARGEPRHTLREIERLVEPTGEPSQRMQRHRHQAGRILEQRSAPLDQQPGERTRE